MKLEKMTRRSLAMLLVMMMVFSLAVPAFADTGIADGTAVSEEDHNHNNEATSENNPSDEGNGNAADTNDGDAEEHVHNFTILVENTATCEEAGIITYACECGETMTEEAEALGHDIIVDAEATIEPTCETGGCIVEHCSRCPNATHSELVPALGHDFEIIEIAPTCVEPGKTVYKCKREGYNEERVEINSETNPLNHVWDEGIAVTPAACETAGVMSYTCTLCGETREEELPALGHDYEYSYDDPEAVHPTCYSLGLAKGTCTRCGDRPLGFLQVEMLPHTIDREKGEIITPAAIGVKGTIKYVCEVEECHAEIFEDIPALPEPSRPSGGGGGGAAAPAPVEIDEPDVPLAAALPFDDVKENSWFREAVQYVYDNDLMSGEEDTVFNPNGATTRGMIVKTLYNMEKEPAVSSAAVFSDVVSGKWYSDAVLWAAENEIVTGYDDGSFRPENSITRQELAAILYRYAEYKKYDVTGKAELSAYADANAVSNFAKGAVEWSVKADLISGIESDGVTVLAPANGATRAQLATILMRFNQSFAASEGETK